VERAELAQSVSAEQSALVPEVVRAFALASEERDGDMLADAQRLLLGVASPPRAADPSLGFEAFTRSLTELFEHELRSGRLVVTKRSGGSFTERSRLDIPDLPPLPPARPDAPTFSFEVRFVDEISQGLNGLEVEFFSAEGVSNGRTNAAGVATLDDTLFSAASVAPVDTAAVEKLLDSRWNKLRSASGPKDSVRAELAFDGGALPSVAIKPVVPNSIVLRPVLGKVHLRLVDKRNRVALGNRKYVLSGPDERAGETDARGELLQEGLPYGDAQLTVELDDGPVQVAAMVMNSSAPIQVRRVAVLPHVALAELRGLFFDTNKSFLLPASTAVFDRVRQVYVENAPSELLVVGHTDTTAESDINDPLSLERAKNTLAFLLDDVETWLDMYTSKVPEGRRWGSEEDQAMVDAMPDANDILPGEDPIRWFQRSRNLDVDGVAGPKTRRELIREYMSLDGASLSELDLHISARAHGCGEHFPLDAAQADVDQAPADNARDQGDRRVELFFFDPDFGVQPPPPGDNSRASDKQYLAWRKQAKQSALIDLAAESIQVTVVDELGTPLPGLAIEVERSSGGKLTGTLDGNGFISLPVATKDACVVRATGIDETTLVSAPTPDETASTAANLATDGVTVLPGIATRIVVALGDLLVCADEDTDVALTLQSNDGTFTQTLHSQVDGAAENGSVDLLFTGLLTLDRTYSLSSTIGSDTATIFDGIPYAQLRTLSEQLTPTQVEPTSGGVDGRISRDELDRTGDPNRVVV